MSTISETSQLNPIGHMALGGLSSIAVNAGVHPICTLKTRAMASAAAARPSLNFRRLYAGYFAVCGVDAAAFGIAFWVNNSWGPAAAGILSTPVICGGEALMANRQLGVRYSAALKIAFRPAGLVATVAREIPYNEATLRYADRLHASMLQRWTRATGQEHPSPVASVVFQGIAGAITGGIAGIITAPIDLVKTRVQTSVQPLSIYAALCAIRKESGWRGFMRGSGLRGIYIALAGIGVTITRNTLPTHFPSLFKTPLEAPVMK